MTVLSVLRSAEGRFLSGADLAKRHGMSRMAVWKQVEILRARGYVIEARPRLGYRFLSAPDKPYEEEVRNGLETRVFGCRVLYFQDVPSTNDVAKRLGGEGCPEGTLVVAERQTAGRGRLGRSWSSPPGGLWFSLIVRPVLSLPELGLLTLVAAAAMVRAVRLVTGIQAAIKWPNDLVAGELKLAGILAEATGELGRASLVVLGVGLNVNQRAEDFPVEVRERATSLRLLLGGETLRVPLLRQFLAEFEAFYQDGKEGFDRALGEAAACSNTLGRHVRVDTGRRPVAGMAVRLDPDGALVVAAGREEVRITAGEVEHVGDAG